MTTEFSSVEMIQLVVDKYSLTLQGHLVFPFFCLLPSFFCSLQTVKTSVVVFLAENNIFFNQKFFYIKPKANQKGEEDNLTIYSIFILLVQLL